MTQASDIGVFDIFKVGVGPSSSHTVGPLKAANRFRALLAGRLGAAACRLRVELYGSLSKTGPGHCTDGAVCAGLLGLDAAASPVDGIWGAKPAMEARGGFGLDRGTVRFDPARDFAWKGWKLDGRRIAHPNTMRFVAEFDDGEALTLTARSVGGGFVEYDAQDAAQDAPLPAVPHPFDTADALVARCEAAGRPLAELLAENEAARGHDDDALRAGLMRIWQTMNDSIERGLRTEGVLPGGLDVRRRAPTLYRQLTGSARRHRVPDLRVSAYAFAVNEENAAGGRVVTAPTNGSAGIIPAVLRELVNEENPDPRRITDGLLVAGAIGAVVKRGASISGAEVGCQGEVGTSCAMAAALAVDMLGGTVRQVEAAAEIAIEHHLGMTCDPVNGLVQIPCIERNGMGAVKALAAASMALASDGTHLVSLDRVLRVMKQTGLDMKEKYRETATGGLGIG